MVQQIVELFKWNAWANQLYRDVLEQIPLDELNFETPYGNLLDRIVHIFASFEMWYKRMNGESPQTVVKASDFSSWSDLNSKWKAYEELLLKYVNSLTNVDLEKEVTYTSFDGRIYSRKIKHILLHLTAHPNYHRGQISAIFKLNNMSMLPATDMVLYFLEHP